MMDTPDPTRSDPAASARELPALEALQRLARQYGIEESYVDIEGRRWHADADALVAILGALGAPVQSVHDAPAALADKRIEHWRTPVAPVVVAWNGRGSVALHLPASVRGGWSMTLTGEDGSTIRVDGELTETAEAIAASAEVDGTRYLARQLPLPKLALGYYDARIEVGTIDAHCRVLAAPPRAWSPEGHHRHWGVFVPAHAVHSEASRGAGDLSDLRALLQLVCERGGSVVGTLPMLAAYLDTPFEPSPYSPASRLAWGELFVDPTAVPEFAETPAAWTALHRKDSHALIAELRAAKLVDYRRQYALQREVLSAMAESCWTRGGARKDALLAFAKARPEIDDYSRFRAVVNRRQEVWPDWPGALRDGTITAADFDPADYRYHLFSQLCMHEQLTALSQATPAGALGLYLDLPVGVGGASYDTWRERECYVLGLSTGAPPDLLFSGGQNWAFPPLHPERIREGGYRHLIDVLRNHLRYAGVLRIDHVMGLHRLYVIPQGRSAKEGVYVRYRSEELYAILTIESHRAKVLLAGEDLGTVPDMVRETMSRTGVHGLHVLQYEARADRLEALPPAPEHSVATINTHDMPPFAAYWSAADVDARAALGWLDEGEVAQQKAERARLRASLRRYLDRHRPLAPDADAREALRAAITHLGRSEARVALVSLEDLWGELEPQNVPGTWKECPNWQRRAQLSLEELSTDPQVTTMLAELDRARRGHERNTAGPVRHDITRLTEDDLYLFNEGTHERAYDKLGAHPMEVDGPAGTYFAVWAPSATYVAVVGDFNNWDRARHPLAARGGSGIWEGFIPGVGTGELYKFHIGGVDGWSADKADPYAQSLEAAPRTASIVADMDYAWQDAAWMETRAALQGHDAPISIYEVHLGSWMRIPEEDGRWLSYRELGPRLAEHVKRLGFTHVELLPVMEHPFYGSWGYQVTGYFAATSRYGRPADLMAMIDHLHQQGIGVILDWVPSHFPEDAHALALFDGTHLYEHADPRQGFHPDWSSCIFNYGRHEVGSFLVSSALFWLDKFHADGLRVDGVASMLYRDYSRNAGEWIPNEYGGRENLEAIAVLRQLNEAVYRNFPDVQTYAEESTAWPMVSRPTHVGGLGFGYKWDMGWMHDTLALPRPRAGPPQLPPKRADLPDALRVG